jgi:hypothetical protein
LKWDLSERTFVGGSSVPSLSNNFISFAIGVAVGDDLYTGPVEFEVKGSKAGVIVV